MYIADAHCDTLYEHAIMGTAPERCCVTLERLTAGNVTLQTFAMFTGKHGTAGTAYADGRAMLEASYRLPLPILRGRLPESIPTVPTGVISCEGGEMLEGSLDRLAEFDDETRLRMLTLTWNFENEIGHPAKLGTDKGLKPFGFELLRELDRRGILADVSHLNDAGFWDVIENTKLPPIASHSDCRWLCDVPRNLTKDMVKALIERRGFIGINFYGGFIGNEPCTLDDLRRHIDAMYELGAEDILGFGSDFDGIDTWPEGLVHPGDFPALLDYLAGHGYTEQQLTKLAHANLWRVLKQADDARSC